jgi:hypothetical protein
MSPGEVSVYAPDLWDADRTPLNLDPLDLSGLGLFEELRVTHGFSRFLAAFELLEDREQDERDHHPDGGFREHVVVQGKLLEAAPRGASARGQIGSLSV